MQMTTTQLRAKSADELKLELVSCIQELGKLRYDASFNKLKNVKALAQARRQKARILTLLREKQVV
ncbi:50S ribosomal protein L29 [Candidatus Azambacteria bacterium]|nr:50S ribosomal protein L29 [Candidatus Azambacteria bacterium]MBI3684896.1 50S ribosomal protein L29 [Candidatus Azambacteria bacterium]